MKNHRQQILPLSSSLKAALEVYLRIWDWDDDNYLFPGCHNEQLQAHKIELAI